MDSLGSLFTAGELGWKDALDVVLVALVAYAFILLLRRTRSAPVAIGILAFFVLWQFVSLLELETMVTLMDFALAAMPLVVVLLFQNPIRRGLSTLPIGVSL